MALTLTRFIERAGDFNPQLFRELKSRLTPRNIVLISAVGILGQLAFFYFFFSSLPARIGVTYNRYCLGSPPPDWNGYHEPNSYIPDNFCVQDLLGKWVINWQLWWLDLFITLSIIGLTILLIVGTYLLIADLTQEERQGTLNFIRLSPQSAKTIFLGKLLGVPALLYLLTLITIPLHFIAGLMTGIPIILILSFYIVVIASCAFFFNLALLMGLTRSKIIALQSFAISGSLLFYLLIMIVITLWSDQGFYHSPLDWISLFYPGKFLVYLVQSTFLPSKTIGYLKETSLTGLLWYGQPIFANIWTAITFILVNYSIWIYGITRAINRRFRRSHSVWLSKQQSYGLSLSFVITILGFVAQTNTSRALYYNFIILQFLLFIFFVILMTCLSPQRQILQDWSRYRHQDQSDQTPRSFIKDLIFGEQSPSTIAIAINAGITFLYVLPAVLIFPLENYRFPVFMGLLLGLTMNIFYALIFQRLLLLKTSHRLMTAASIFSILTIFPVIAVVIIGSKFTFISSSILFFTFVPIAAGEFAFGIGAFIALLGQWTAILIIGRQMTKQLKKLGSSESKFVNNS